MVGNLVVLLNVLILPVFLQTEITVADLAIQNYEV